MCRTKITFVATFTGTIFRYEFHRSTGIVSIQRPVIRLLNMKITGYVRTMIVINTQKRCQILTFQFRDGRDNCKSIELSSLSGNIFIFDGTRFYDSFFSMILVKLLFFSLFLPSKYKRQEKDDTHLFCYLNNCKRNEC